MIQNICMDTNNCKWFSYYRMKYVDCSWLLSSLCTEYVWQNACQFSCPYNSNATAILKWSLYRVHSMAYNYN